jgi:hypothetical protein
MSAKNTQSQPQVEYVSKRKAMEMLGITSEGAYSAACKTHSYLKPIRERHPETDSMWSKVSIEAIERYIAERGNRGGSRDGLKWYNLRLSDAEAVELAAWASDRFGRTVEAVKPANRSKDNDGAETDGEA